MESSSKAKVVIEVVTDTNTYSFTMPIGAGFGEAYDAAYKVLQELAAMAQKATDAAARQVTPATPAATN